MPNQYASIHRLTSDPQTAVTEASLLIREAFDGQIPDLIFAFAAGYAGAEFDLAMPKIASLTGCQNVVGNSCVSLISGEHEFERQSGLCLWAARFDNASVTPFHLTFNTRGGESFFAGWPESAEQPWSDDTRLFLLTEPFSFPVDVLLEQINEDHPGTLMFGGVADGATQPNESRLLLGDQTFSDGAIAVMVSGVPIDSVVSQGCRPIGKPHIVTGAERNTIQSLGGKPAFDVLKEVYDELPTQDKALVEKGLHLGIAMTEWKDKFAYGDFLIRNVTGIDEPGKTVTLSDFIRVGKTVQFHIRDHQSASVELDSMLTRMAETADFQPQSALVFSCNGRGTYLFPEPHHDAQKVQHMLAQHADVNASAGFFAAGEIGSVQGQGFLHGFTASIAVFG